MQLSMLLGCCMVQCMIERAVKHFACARYQTHPFHLQIPWSVQGRAACQVSKDELTESGAMIRDSNNSKGTFNQGAAVVTKTLMSCWMSATPYMLSSTSLDVHEHLTATGCLTYLQLDTVRRQLRRRDAPRAGPDQRVTDSYSCAAHL